MNPIVSKLLENINQLSEELQRSSGSNSGSFQRQTNDEVSRAFRRTVQQSASSSITTAATSTASTSSHSLPSASTSASHTQRFRLGYNFLRNRGTSQSRSRKPKVQAKKVFLKDVVLLGGPGDDVVPRQGTKVFLMENKHIVSSVEFDKSWDHLTVLDKLRSLFPDKIGEFDDIELLIPVHHKLMVPQLSKDQTLSALLIQKIFKDKPIYVRPQQQIINIYEEASHKRKYEEIEVASSDDEQDDDHDLTVSAFKEPAELPQNDSTSTSGPTELPPDESTNTISGSAELIQNEPTNTSDQAELPNNRPTNNHPCDSATPILTPSEVCAYDPIIDEINQKEISDPVEMLRLLQKRLVKGRELDVADASSSSEGATNYICVDRDHILKTTFAELDSIEDFLITFEVDFMGELAKDFGGPRKEWIQIVNIAMKDKYFDKGLREYLADDYYYVGVMMGVAILQNGQLPTILPPDMIDQLILPSTNQCITNLQKGLNKCGLVTIFKRKPVLLYLLRPRNETLSAQMLIKILTPEFAPEGSTAHSKEKQIYALFVKYVRQVASGRRLPLTLSSILTFVTGAAEEPVLGFVKHPSITFVHGQTNNKASEESVCYIPTAHTCSNNLVLPRGPLLRALPNEEVLFEMYDLAFSNNHFGIV